MRKDRLKRVFSLVTVCLLCFVFSSSVFAEMPIPDFKPDLGIFTSMPEATPYELLSSPSLTSNPVKGLPSKKGDVVEVKEDKDYLTIYAPEGFSFILHAEFLNGDPLNRRFVGKGVSTVAAKIPYSTFDGLIITASPIIAPASTFDSCLLSASPYGYSPSFPNDWFEFEESQNDSGVIFLPFVTFCMNFGGVLYVHPCDRAGRPIDGVWPTPNPTPTPTPTPLPDMQDSEGITGIVDFTNVFNSVAFIGTFMRAIYTFFPYLIAIVWLAIVVMIIRLIVS